MIHKIRLPATSVWIIDATGSTGRHLFGATEDIPKSIVPPQPLIIVPSTTLLVISAWINLYMLQDRCEWIFWWPGTQVDHYFDGIRRVCRCPTVERLKNIRKIRHSCKLEEADPHPISILEALTCHPWWVLENWWSTPSSWLVVEVMIEMA